MAAANNKYLTIGGITFDECSDHTKWNTRILCLWLQTFNTKEGTSLYYPITQDWNSGNKNYYKPQKFDRGFLDSQWHWIYFGYSPKKQLV